MTLYCFYFYDINNIFVFSDRIFRACEPNLWNSIRVLHKHIMSRYARTRTQVIIQYTLYPGNIQYTLYPDHNFRKLNPNFSKLGSHTLRSLKIFILALSINLKSILDWISKTWFPGDQVTSFPAHMTQIGWDQDPGLILRFFSTFKCFRLLFLLLTCLIHINKHLYYRKRFT